MSRTQHARPRQDPGDYSRIRNAAISVADTYRRFERDLARLQREIKESALPPAEKQRAVNSAALGRTDRADALNVVFARVAGLDEEEEP